MIQNSRWICAIYLIILSVIDWRNCRLPVWLLSVGGCLALGYQISWKELPLILILSGAVVGILFLGISKITEEAFGYGDSILIIVLGVYMGLWNLLALLVVAFLFTAVAAILVLIRKKFQKQAILPFVPFLSCGYVVLILMGGF